MNLTENFTLDEMIKSQTAERKGIDNYPEKEHIENLKLLAENILQPIRDKFGAFIVSSGYRSPELCVAVGSTIKSQHAKGQAADFEVSGIDNYDLLDNDIKKPIKEDYSDWDDYWISLTSYMKEKYRYTYGSKAQEE